MKPENRVLKWPQSQSTDDHLRQEDFKKHEIMIASSPVETAANDLALLIDSVGFNVLLNTL